MKQALKAIDWSHQAKPGCTVIPRTDTAADDIVSVAAATQVTLWATRCDESPGGRRFEEDP
jgi:hypothetical protein